MKDFAVVVDFSNGWSTNAVKQFLTLGFASFNDDISYLSLLANNPVSNSGVAWFGVYDTATATVIPKPQKLSSGFEIDFSFVFTGASEGFAVVLQSASQFARGSEASGLGYNGILNSLAIEFDGVYSPEWYDQQPYTCETQINNNMCESHVSIHTAYTGKNSASESSEYNLGSFNGTLSSPLLFMNFQNGTTHNVRIVYLPPDSFTGSTLGWIKVYMGVDAFTQNLSPVAQGQIDSAKLGAAWGGAAYVGFTASSSEFILLNLNY